MDALPPSASVGVRPRCRRPLFWMRLSRYLAELPPLGCPAGAQRPTRCVVLFPLAAHGAPTAWRLHLMRLRPPRHARPLSGVRHGSADEGDDVKRRLFTLLAAIS